MPPRMTIGMATYDDYDGVYFSLQSIRLHHPEILDVVEFVVVDNNPSGRCGSSLRKLCDVIPNCRYVPETMLSGTAVRGRIFELSQAEIVLCMDCHVLFPPNALSSVLAYFDEHPTSRDLVQGPLLDDNMSHMSSHWIPVWKRGMFGEWAWDSSAEDPQAPAFPIPMQGLGVFVCRKAAWPGFNPHFRGFGGEEGYLHDKFRLRGARVLCLPALRWVHRFARPLGVPYEINWEDRLHNYLFGRDELQLSTTDIIVHMTQYLGPDHVRELVGAYEERCHQISMWAEA